MPDKKQTSGTKDLSARTAARRVRNRSMQIDKAVDSASGSSSKRTSSRRHPSSSAASSRRNSSYKVDKDDYTRGKHGEKSYSQFSTKKKKR